MKLPLTQSEVEKHERLAFANKKRRVRKKNLKLMMNDNVFGDYSLDVVSYDFHMSHCEEKCRYVYAERSEFDENFDIITKGYSDSFCLLPDKHIEVRDASGDGFTKFIGRFCTFKNAIKWINRNGGEYGKFTVYTPTRVYHVWNNTTLGHIGARRCMEAIFGGENSESVRDSE